MRFAIGVGAALGLGGVVGFVVGWCVLEEKTYKKYQASLDETVAAYYKAAESVDHSEVIEPMEGEPLQTNNIEVVKDGDILAKYEPSSENPYWEAPEIPIHSAEVDLQLSYIEEEDYLDEDGRAKLQICVMMDDREPIFTLDNEQMADWDAHVGPNIVQDLINMTPPGQQQVLYVRNHKTDCDYEVMRVSP